MPLIPQINFVQTKNMKIFQKKKKTYRSLQIDWSLELKRVAHVTFPTRLCGWFGYKSAIRFFFTPCWPKTQVAQKVSLCPSYFLGSLFEVTFLTHFLKSHTWVTFLIQLLGQLYIPDQAADSEKWLSMWPHKVTSSLKWPMTQEQRPKYRIDDQQNLNVLDQTRTSSIKKKSVQS